ncbi:hypothetical protein BFZC1_09545 [Lysinibacillus fusiformis ZC1]|nr:hypothetical protein BFZC1_09545 [Lysinibacillus fusiformis ZC1]
MQIRSINDSFLINKKKKELKILKGFAEVEDVIIEILSYLLNTFHRNHSFF